MEYTYCVDCGKKIFEGIVFCPKCGADQTPSFSEKEIDKSPYKILQVSENAEPEVIKAAYKSLSKKYHPDIDSSRNAQEKMKDINWAYSILSNSEKRKEWDISYIRRTRKPTETQSQKSSSAFRNDPRTRYQERYDEKYSPDQSWPKQSKPKKSPGPPTRKKKTDQPKYPFLGRITLFIFIISLFVAVVLGISSINSSSPPASSESVSIPKKVKTRRPPTATPLPSSIIPPYFEDFSSGPGVWYVGEDEEGSFSVSNEQYLIKADGGYSYVGANLDNVMFEFTTRFLYSYPSQDAGFLVKFRCYFKNECYTMVVNEQGYLGVVRGEDYLITEKPSAKINLYDHPNEWAIIMDGKNFEIHCNGELITAFSDNNYRRGDIGFGVYNSNGVAFDNIRISSLR